MTHEHVNLPEEPEGTLPLLSGVMERNIRTITRLRLQTVRERTVQEPWLTSPHGRSHAAGCTPQHRTHAPYMALLHASHACIGVGTAAAMASGGVWAPAVYRADGCQRLWPCAATARSGMMRGRRTYVPAPPRIPNEEDTHVAAT
jgi:hypothetical protein